MPRRLPNMTPFLDRFFIDFCSQLGPPEPHKSLKFHWFYRHFWLCGIFIIRSNFDPILVPTRLHFGSQNPPKPSQKSIPRCTQFFIDFCIEFFSIWAPSWDPSWAHVGHFFATRRPQDPPKKHQKLIPTLKTAQNASWTRPGALQTSILAPLDLHFAPPDLDFGAPRPRFLNVLGLFLCYITTLLHCHFVTLLLCYFATLLLWSWRGGGVAALLRCWIYIYIYIDTLM